MKIILIHEGETHSIENDAVTAHRVIGSLLRLMLAAGWSKSNLDEATDGLLESEEAWLG